VSSGLELEELGEAAAAEKEARMWLCCEVGINSIVGKALIQGSAHISSSAQKVHD
jgi:hypothetical protein